MPSRRADKTLTKTQQRKKEHLELCLDTKTILGPTGSGLASYTFVHNALPDLDIDEIDIETTFLGKRLKAPLLISSMTGGFSLARKVNRNLAAAASRPKLPFGLLVPASRRSMSRAREALRGTRLRLPGRPRPDSRWMSRLPTGAF